MHHHRPPVRASTTQTVHQIYINTGAKNLVFKFCSEQLSKSRIITASKPPQPLESLSTNALLYQHPTHSDSIDPLAISFLRHVQALFHISTIRLFLPPPTSVYRHTSSQHHPLLLHPFLIVANQITRYHGTGTCISRSHGRDSHCSNPVGKSVE